MNTTNNTSKVLGTAFLLQAVTSLSSGLILKLALTVPGNISETMIKIASNPWLMRVNILGEMITALGIIFLGAFLFVTLRNRAKKWLWFPWDSMSWKRYCLLPVDSRLSLS
jgi:Domain of unknown function (DUF4386)